METEKRLIDANALEEMVKFIDKPALMIVRDAPTVDAVEVVHGQWKYYHKQNIAVCTNCSFERDLDANFGSAVSCPNCGARMDGRGVTDGRL